MKYTVEVMISTQEIANRITELGQSISKYYCNSLSKIILIGLLRGSFIFISDLCRAISITHEIDFMTVSSYGNGMNSKHVVKITKDLDIDINGKEVLIVDDIIDSGITLSQIYKILSLRQPKSIAICTLLDKPDRREVKLSVAWVGFTIPDEFVVGYGIDYAQKYRHLPYIGKIILVSHNI